ncbi:hypothetical protein WN48_01775 [Eufriesea mexicana]|uniref:Uncharacterized protein n=1 Tax=Eufriesea mexicana TaxID=516756 RepID=A0A310SCI2_9HYME|nr:hypothetical protein WN48_01775 [Eufriesea mexicana]
MEEREDYLIRNGVSKLGLEQERRNGRSEKEIIESLRKRDTERQGQVQYNKIQRSRYNEGYKYILTTGLPEYSGKEGNGESQQLIPEARCDSFESWNRYWEEEVKRKCELCEDALETMQHLVRDCRMMDREVRIEDILGGRKDKKVENWLRRVKWKKKIVREGRT